MSWLDALVSLHHRLLPDLRRTPGLIRDVSAADGWRCGVRLLEALQRQRQRRDVVMVNSAAGACGKARCRHCGRGGACESRGRFQTWKWRKMT